MSNNFAVIILSHGRANNVKTVETLFKSGYTGRYYILVDDEDKDLPAYIKNFGEEHILVFSKAEAIKTFDIMDNFPGKGVPTYARNMLFVFAEKLNLTYFLELEDDYTCFRQRYEDDNGVLRTRYVRDFDSVVDAYIEFLELSGAVTVAFAQTGDLIGGKSSKVWKSGLSRKAMNCFFCKTDRPFKYLGRFNDDVNAYIEFGKRGSLFFTTRDIVMDQPQTQLNAGGITAAYKQYGTYVKSFYSVMLCPSFVQIYSMGQTHHRVHHVIDWEKAVPKIISSDFKKGETE